MPILSSTRTVVAVVEGRIAVVTLQFCSASQDFSDGLAPSDDDDSLALEFCKPIFSNFSDESEETMQKKIIVKFPKAIF